MGLFALDWGARLRFVHDLVATEAIAASLFHPEPRLRAFARQDGSAAVFLLVNDGPWINSDPSKEELDILICSREDEAADLASAVSRALTSRLRPHTFGDLAFAEMCTQVFTGLSPNGRLLMDPAVQHAAESMVEITTREKVRARGTGSGMRPESCAVRQGLWLEWLTYRLLRSHTSLLWHGVMAGGHELDVIGVMNENVFTVECKDTSLGVNDMIVAIHKAKQLSADLVLLVTTRPIHPNVHFAIDQHLSRTESSEPPCGVIPVHVDEAQAEGQLDEAIRHIAGHAMKNWFAGRRTTMSSDLFFATDNLSRQCQL
jgi:hypothetical protein